MKCLKCGYKLKFRDLSRKGKVFFFIKRFFIIIFIFLAMIGAGGIYNTVISFNFDKNLLFSSGGLYSFFENEVTSNLMPKSVKKTLKPLAENITKNCHTDKCKAFELFDYLNKFKYDVGGDSLLPLKILREKECDCDECSYLYMLMLKEINIYSKMVCNYNHCWIIMDVDGEKYKADIVSGILNNLRK